MSALRVVMLGSGTALPDAARGPAGIAMLGPRSTWWLDCGSGTLQRSARYGVDPLALDGVVLSHHHPDHCADLVPLLFARRVAGTTRPLRLVAGEGFEVLWRHLQRAWGRWIAPPGGVDLVIVPRDAPQTLPLGDLTLHTAAANHGASGLHLRVAHGEASVTFSGDTGPSPALAALAEGTGLLVCECGATDHAPAPATHLSADEVAEVARRARPGVLWVTHLYDHPAAPGRVDARAVMRRIRRGVPHLVVRRARDGDRWPR